MLQHLPAIVCVAGRKAIKDGGQTSNLKEPRIKYRGAMNYYGQARTEGGGGAQPPPPPPHVHVPLRYDKIKTKKVGKR